MKETTTYPELLGSTLRKAGLISLAQIQVALVDQEYNQQMRIGEVLALRGWIKQSTADFFADEWSLLLKKSAKYPLGYYFAEADLMDLSQINAVLQEQKQLWIKFGSVAVIKGFIQQQTLDFFLAHLFPLALSEAPTIGAQINQDKQQPTKNTVDDELKNVLAPIDYDDIPWID